MVGFAGATADALTLMTRLETKIEAYPSTCADVARWSPLQCEYPPPFSLWLPQTNWSVHVWSWQRSGERRSTCGSWRWGVVLPSLVSPPCVHVLVSFPCPNIDASARDRRFVWDVSWGCGTLGRLAVVVVAVVVNAGGHARRGQGRVVHVDGCRRRHRAARWHYGCRIWWRLCSRWVPPLPLDERSVACLVVRFVCVPVTRHLWCDRSCSPPPLATRLPC